MSRHLHCIIVGVLPSPLHEWNTCVARRPSAQGQAIAAHPLPRAIHTAMAVTRLPLLSSMRPASYNRGLVFRLQPYSVPRLNHEAWQAISPYLGKI